MGREAQMLPGRASGPGHLRPYGGQGCRTQAAAGWGKDQGRTRAEPLGQGGLALPSPMCVERTALHTSWCNPGKRDTGYKKPPGRWGLFWEDPPKGVP